MSHFKSSNLKSRVPIIMKTVLCYGDSNVYGYVPLTGGRYDVKTRWPGVLREALNADSPQGQPNWWVVEEGLNGRTTCRDDPFELYRNGLAHIVPILKSHKPIDVVVTMLGTNDTKRRFNPSAYDISEGMLLLVKAIQHSESGPNDGAPAVIIVCPPLIVENPVWGDVFEGASCISAALSAQYQRILPEAHAAGFIDAGTLVQPSADDGVHLDAAGHHTLGLAVAERVRSITA
jgi:lysophospholipase L1-like esterase